MGKKYRYLGLFSTEEEAATAYDREAVRIKGLDAITNFAITEYEEILADHLTASVSGRSSGGGSRGTGGGAESNAAWTDACAPGAKITSLPADEDAGAGGSPSPAAFSVLQPGLCQGHASRWCSLEQNRATPQLVHLVPSAPHQHRSGSSPSSLSNRQVEHAHPENAREFAEVFF